MWERLSRHHKLNLKSFLNEDTNVLTQGANAAEFVVHLEQQSVGPKKDDDTIHPGPSFHS